MKTDHCFISFISFNIFYIVFALCNDNAIGRETKTTDFHRFRQLCKDIPDSWQDRLGNTCSWYAEERNMRCAEAPYFAINGISAKDSCCACFGGTTSMKKNIIHKEMEGYYHIQSKLTHTYIGLHDDGSVTSYIERTSQTIMYLNGTNDSIDNMYSLRFHNGDYLSVNNNNTVVSWTGSVRDSETFECLDVPSRSSKSALVGFKNLKNDNAYLAIQKGVRVVSSLLKKGATFKMIKIIDIKELQDVGITES